ncbi:MAG: MFS transporter [bacterium]|nr:MFS transporter [bacterium]MCP5065456.1 MFS transporter [bacterium]
MASPPSTSSTPSSLPFGQILAYGAPSLASVAIAIVMGIHLPIFYSDTVLVPLGAIALVKAVVRASDALTDLPIGWLSDRTRTRWGRRRPWIAVGAPFAAVSFWALFSPPADLEGLAAISWLAITYALFYIGHTAYIIPHYGLGAELTNDHHERTRIFGWREAFVIVGTLIAALAPAVLEEILGSTRAAFAGFATAAAILLVVLYWNLVRVVPERSDYLMRPTNPLVPGIRRCLRNPVFRLVLIAHTVHAITAGIPPIMTPYFLKYVVQPGDFSFWFAAFLAAYFGTAFLTLPLWIRLARIRGKRFAWIASIVPGILALFALFFMGPGDVIPAALIFGLAGTGFGPAIFITQSILADVIDYDELHTGHRREAQYTAFWSFLQKFTVIPSASIPLAILASAGFVPNVPQSETVQLVIRSIYSIAPAVIALITILIAWRYPLTQAVHEAIREGVTHHENGLPASDPLTGRVIPPPGDAEHEETGWFLDHFSQRELGWLAARGPLPVQASALASALGSIFVCSLGSVMALKSLGGVEQAPGVGAVLWIVAAGFGLSAAVYHGIRLIASRRLPSEGGSAERIRRHVQAVRHTWHEE